MALYQDVIISGDADGMAEFRRRLGSIEVSGWRRDLAAEGRLRSMKAGPEGALCLTREADDDLPAVALWYVPQGPGRLGLSNMIPLERGSALDQARFSKVLEDFNRRLFAPANEGLAMEWSEVSRSDPSRVLSGPALRKFRSFVRAADRRALRPADHARWNDFLVQVHRDNSPVEPEMLVEWLGAEEGWAESSVSSLVHDFESARSLLAVYDEELASR